MKVSVGSLPFYCSSAACCSAILNGRAVSCVQIKFSNDAIDESDELEEVLRSSTATSAGGDADAADRFLLVERLPGTHLTPLAQVGRVPF